MNEKVNDWSDLQLFLAVAREGGLSAAARATGKSPATLGRRMLSLERSMGTDLVVRRDRGYALTVAGRALADELTEIAARLDRVAPPAPGDALPLVKISAGTWTTFYLMQRVQSLSGSPADLRLRFVSAEAPMDIARREVMVGLRNRAPEGAGLAGRQMGPVHFAPFGVRDGQGGWIKVIGNTPSAHWVDRHAEDATIEVTSPRNALDLALLGHGRVVLPTFIGDNHAGLERKGSVIEELTHHTWVVTHNDDRHLPEVRRFLNRLYGFMTPGE